MNSEKTAITRKRPSAPAKWIHDHYLLPERVVNWGEGKAFLDSELLGAEGYDPFSPIDDHCTLNEGFYDLGVCIYVLNTLLPAGDDGRPLGGSRPREDALCEMMTYCQNALVAVRTDTKNLVGEPYLDGVITKRGTFQAQLNAEEWKSWVSETLDWPIGFDISILHRGSGYVIIEIVGRDYPDSEVGDKLVSKVSLEKVA